MSPRLRGLLGRAALVLAGVVLEVAVQPPGPLPALVFVQDTPFLLLLWHGGGARWKRWAWFYGFAKFAAGLRWIAEVHWTMAIGAPFVLAFAYLAWAAGLRFLVRRGVPYLPAVGVTAVLEEVLQTVIQGASGMPWPARSLAFGAWPSLVGASAYFGAYGLSGLAAVTSAWASGLPSLVRRGEGRGERVRTLVRSGVPCALLLGGALWLGASQVLEVEGRMAGPFPLAARTDPIVVVQGDVSQSLKNERSERDAANRIFDTHVRLTQEALRTLADERRSPLAVLWPETMIPWPFLDPALAGKFPEDWRNEHVILDDLRQSVPPRTTTRFLLGVNYYFVGASGPHAALLDHDSTDSLLFVDVARVPPEPPRPGDVPPGGAPPWMLPVGRHDKAILVPWGEYTPGGGVLPFLRGVRDRLSIIPEITAGSRDQEPFLLALAPGETPGAPNRKVLAGTIICFEIAFPARCREWRDKGATVLLNAGNYAWYGDTGMPAQVVALGKLRAAELAVTVVIAGNTGPTCIVDPSGAVREQVRVAGRTQYVEGWCAGPLWSDPGYHTLYSRLGDVPWLVAGGLLFGLALLRPRHRSVTASAGAPGGQTAPRTEASGEASDASPPPPSA